MRSFAHIFTAHDTDKQSRHGYGEVYDLILGRHRGTARRVLELGVDKGGSLLAWLEAFPHAEVCGVDLRQVNVEAQRLTVIQADAYTPQFWGDLPGRWDVIVDDGPHTLESMRFVAARYPRKLASGGTLIIEDVPDPRWIRKLAAELPPGFAHRAFGVDRSFVGADDSRLFVVELRAA